MYGCSVLWHLLSNQSQLLVLFAYMANCFRSHVDTNDIFIKSYEIAIGGSYKKQFFEEFVMKKAAERIIQMINLENHRQ